MVKVSCCTPSRFLFGPSLNYLEIPCRLVAGATLHLATSCLTIAVANSATMSRPLPLAYNLKPQMTHKGARQRSRLLSLPPKTVKRIFKKIRHPRDQVAFMLTCKKAAKTTANIRLNTATTIVMNGTCQKRRPYAHLHLLGALRKWSYIPNHLQLCRNCEKYLPRDRIWIARNGKPITELEHVDWLWTVGRWTRGGKTCPTCEIGDFEEGKEWLQASPEGHGVGMLRRQQLE